MPDRLDGFASAVAWTILCFGVCGLLSGCDGGGSKQASNFQRLVGTWRVQELDVNGISGQLDGRDDTLTITFRSLNDGDRRFRVAWLNGSSPEVQGSIRVLTPNSMAMTSSRFSRSVLWRFDFGRLSNDVTLRSSEQDLGSRTFLDAILPEVGWGKRQSVTLRLVLCES